MLAFAQLALLASSAFLVLPSVFAYQDAVVIEAASNASSRDKRQGGGFWSNGLVPIGPCFNSKGDFGQCTSFRQCYPYFKLPDLTTWETWVLGLYDTCTYFSPTGKQMFGVCCTSMRPVAPSPPAVPLPPTMPEVEEAEMGGGAPKPGPGPTVPSWPPPLPTHPPDHTIPPLPTHPPSPGWPQAPEAPSTEPTLKPTKPPKPPTFKPKPPQTIKPPQTVKPPLTVKPPNWPPSLPTHPTHPPIPTHKPPPTVQPITEAPAVISDASCGAKNGYQDQERIVGGQNADPDEWPWMAALFNGNRQFCGGSLIDNTHILTAAHCVAHMTSWDVARVTVRLADYNIKTSSETKHIEKKVKRVVRHKGFDSRTLYNDIAILTLDSSVSFSRTVRAICLPSGTARYDGKDATVIGWGSLREGGSQPSVLQEVNIPIWRNDECKAKYGAAAPGGIIDSFLCAGRAAKDSCSGDSGGPLMVNSGKWMQVGIVSWGIGCGKGQYPGVYTRVTSFKSWINKNLK